MGDGISSGLQSVVQRRQCGADSLLLAEVGEEGSLGGGCRGGDVREDCRAEFDETRGATE